MTRTEAQYWARQFKSKLAYICKIIPAGQNEYVLDVYITPEQFPTTVESSEHASELLRALWV
jgi:hypothetical protein